MNDASRGPRPPPLPDWLAAMFPRGMRRRMIDVGDGLHIHVAEVGPGGRAPR